MSPANTQQLQSLGILIKRGLDKGFNAHHVVQQLEHNGYSRTDLLKALQIVEHPELLEQEEAEQRERQIALQEKKAEMEQLREQHPFDKHVTDRKETKRREELFHSFHDKASLALLFGLCALFFLLGIIIDRLVLAI